MRIDRALTVSAMMSLGWEVERFKRGKTAFWRFKRPDTGGLWDVVEVKQKELGIAWVAEQAMHYGDAPELVEKVQTLYDDWFTTLMFNKEKEHGSARPGSLS